MDLAQFQAMIDAHGVRPEHWPRAKWAAAGRLLETSPQAVAVLAKAERFDRMVQNVADHGLAPVGDDDVARMMGAVMARLPDQASLPMTPERLRPGRVGGMLGRGWAVLSGWNLAGGPVGGDWGLRFAVSMVVAVCLGLVVGTAMVDRTQRSYTSVEMLTMVHSSYSSLDMR